MKGMENMEVRVHDKFEELFVGDTYVMRDNAICICSSEPATMTAKASALNAVQDESIVKYTFVDVRTIIPQSFRHADVVILFERNPKRLNVYIPGKTDKLYTIRIEPSFRAFLFSGILDTFGF